MSIPDTLFSLMSHPGDWGFVIEAGMWSGVIVVDEPPGELSGTASGGGMWCSNAEAFRGCVTSIQKNPWSATNGTTPATSSTSISRNSVESCKSDTASMAIGATVEWASGVFGRFPYRSSGNDGASERVPSGPQGSVWGSDGASSCDPSAREHLLLETFETTYRPSVRCSRGLRPGSETRPCPSSAGRCGLDYSDTFGHYCGCSSGGPPRQPCA